MDEDDLKQKLKTEIEKLFNGKWRKIIEEDYPVIEKTKAHRSKLKTIENYSIVKNVLKKFSPITISIFLKKFGSLEEFPGI
jgi:hypothetical protein